MSQGCLKGVSRRLEISKKFQGHFQRRFKVFQGGFKEVSKKFQGHFIGCFKGVSRVF